MRVTAILSSLNRIAISSCGRYTIVWVSLFLLSDLSLFRVETGFPAHTVAVFYCSMMEALAFELLKFDKSLA
jgi:hypothetical protein